MKDGSWQHCNIRSVKPRLDTESVCPSKILVRTPQSALPSGQTLSTPQDEMSACSGMPGPGKVEPSLQRRSTFKPPAGSLFATDGGLLHTLIKNIERSHANKERSHKKKRSRGRL